VACRIRRGFTPVTAECGTAFCSRGGRTTARAVDDGERFWRHDVGTNITEAAPVAVGETVDVVDSRRVHALDAVTGEQRLQTDQQGTISALAADERGPVVTVGSQPTSIRALDPSDGSPDWTASVRNSFTPFVLGDDRVYLVEQQEGLVAFDRTTGERV
jgi:outer membrane protein assembly factor BamB